ncbi:MAG: hypothetical protein AB7K24_28905 [Gemmataceae bacterium]
MQLILAFLVTVLSPDAADAAKKRLAPLMQPEPWTIPVSAGARDGLIQFDVQVIDIERAQLAKAGQLRNHWFQWEVDEVRTYAEHTLSDKNRAQFLDDMKALQQEKLVGICTGPCLMAGNQQGMEGTLKGPGGLATVFRIRGRELHEDGGLLGPRMLHIELEARMTKPFSLGRHESTFTTEERMESGENRVIVLRPYGQHHEVRILLTPRVLCPAEPPARTSGSIGIDF